MDALSKFDLFIYFCKLLDHSVCIGLQYKTSYNEFESQ